MHGPSPQTISGLVGPIYLGLAAMNGIAAFILWKKEPLVALPDEQALENYVVKEPVGYGAQAFFWLMFSVVCMILSPFAYSGNLDWIPALPDAFRNFVDSNTGPVQYSVLTTLGLIAAYLCRNFLVKPFVAWGIFNLMFVFLALSLPDGDFYAIVAKPDNVPIVALIFLLAFFTWLSASQAVENDRRDDLGLPPVEAMAHLPLKERRVLVWPDLVYIELICMILIVAGLIVWAMFLQAPLEEPASSVKTPNPSKAPWYFLGLQEMLVYYDPWMAGVLLPGVIVGGLCAIPYIDFNKKGNGYYTIKQRSFAYTVFQFGFLEIWITLIILGTFLRGPNWNFFGPYEYWDAHKVEALNNFHLADWFWKDFLGTTSPKAPDGSNETVKFLVILKREAVGIILVLGYFIVLPPLMALMPGLRKFYAKMGLIRFMVLSNLLLFMAALPIKMVLLWTLKLKNLISIPEYFLNF